MFCQNAWQFVINVLGQLDINDMQWYLDALINSIISLDKLIECKIDQISALAYFYVNMMTLSLVTHDRSGPPNVMLWHEMGEILMTSWHHMHGAGCHTWCEWSMSMSGAHMIQVITWRSDRGNIFTHQVEIGAPDHINNIIDSCTWSYE